MAYVAAAALSVAALLIIASLNVCDGLNFLKYRGPGGAGPKHKYQYRPPSGHKMILPLVLTDYIVAGEPETG